MSNNPQPSLIIDRVWNSGTEDIGKTNLEEHGDEHDRLSSTLAGKAEADQDVEQFPTSGGDGSVPVAQSNGSLAMQQEVGLSLGAFQDNTANRSLGTTYTNNTGDVLEVRVILQRPGGVGVPRGELSVNGTVVSDRRGDLNSVTVSVLVRAGDSYTVSDFNNTSIETWFEREYTTTIG